MIAQGRVLFALVCCFCVVSQTRIFCQDLLDETQQLLNGEWNCVKVVSKLGELDSKNLFIDISDNAFTITIDPETKGIVPVTTRYHCTLSRPRHYYPGCAHYADLSIQKTKDSESLHFCGYIKLKDDTMQLKLIPYEKKEIDIEMGVALAFDSVIADMLEEGRKSDMVVREPGSFILHLKKATK
jgi:hypothetical protein